jgi:hypothetical protein
MIVTRWHHALMPDNPAPPDDALEKKTAVPTEELPELASNPLVTAAD